MGFASGSISFRRFAVLGESPEAIDQDLLDKLSEHALRPSELGVPEEIEYGWSGGRHLLDGTFSFENNVFAEALHFALRIDTNKVPADLKRAYAAMEEEAAAATNPSGFISKNQKRDVKDRVRRKVEEELRTGRFRRSKLLPILWDLQSHTLLSSASGAALEQLMELFERTFNLTLLPLTSGSSALRMLEPKARRRDYEDLRPTRFVQSPAGESEWPEYPWVLKGPEPKDFLGNEFLLWLWHETEASDGVVETKDGDVAVLFDRSLDFDCAYDQSGKAALRAVGPTRMPEAHDALRTGKLPRRVGLVLESAGMPFNLTLQGDSFTTNSLKLPPIEEAATTRILFEERIALLRQFLAVMDGLYERFLTIRVGGAWEKQVTRQRTWIRSALTTVAEVA